MSRYSNFGLDENKRSKDSGSKGSKYCPWCIKENISQGMSLCFSNWIICLDCSKQGLRAFKEHTTEKGTDRIQLDNCFKKNNKTTEPCYISLGEGFKVGISLEYLTLANKLLTEKKNLDKNGQWQLLF